MQPALSVCVWVCVQRARKLVETRLHCILALTKLVHSAHGSWWRRGSSIHASLLLALILLHSQLYYSTACTEAGGDEAPQFIPAYMHAHDILAHMRMSYAQRARKLVETRLLNPCQPTCICYVIRMRMLTYYAYAMS
jgi:hypothetical protein